jgi:hypothetical protein
MTISLQAPVAAGGVPPLPVDPSRWPPVPVGLILPLSRTRISRGHFAMWIAPGAQVKHRLPRWARSRSASRGPPKAMTRERTCE